MDKRLLALLIIIVILVLGGATWYAVGRNNMTPTASTNTTSGTGSASGASNGQPAGSPRPSINQPANTTVTIQNFAFSPSTMVVHTGTTITWKNADSVAHTVTETDGRQGPDSASLDPGQSYSFTFKDVGTYHYHCSIHPEMTGTITVTATQ